MRQLLPTLLLLGASLNSFPQSDSEPINGIVITKDSKTNSVVAWDKATGRLTRFNAGQADIKNFKTGDIATVNIKSGKVTSVNNVAKNYAVIKPDRAEPVGIISNLQVDGAEPINGNVTKINANIRISSEEPCCAIVSVQPDPQEPCCNIVMFKDNVTNATARFKAPKGISKNLKIKDPVYAEPVNGIAIVQSTYGGSGELASYGYAIESGENSTGETTSSEKWEITPNNLKGATGRLITDFPTETKWQVNIWTMAGDKFVSTIQNTNKTTSHVLAPGEFRIKLNTVELLNVPVKMGHDTKLKWGLLNIVSETNWVLKDGSGKATYISGNKPVKMAVPIGTYTLKLGGQDLQVTIKQGETSEM